MTAAPGPHKPLPEPRTEGERLFRIATEGMSLAKIARAVDAKHRALVSAWVRGDRRPGPASRASIAAAFDIPIEAWDFVPYGTPVARVVPAAPPAEAESPPAAGNDNGVALVELDPNAPTPTALEDCMAMLRMIRGQLTQPNLAPSQAIKLADSKTKLLVLRARLERDAERSEDRIVREHPAWKRLCRLIVKTLATKHPAALKDLATALGESLEHDSDTNAAAAADSA